MINLSEQTTWTGDDSGLPVIRDGHPFRCHGDALICDLGIARRRLERSLANLIERADYMENISNAYFLGHYVENVVEALQDGLLDSMDPFPFRMRGRHVMDYVTEAEEQDDDEEPSGNCPDSAILRECKALSHALLEHSAALKSLRYTEAQIIAGWRNNP